jgi:hypothetical protein
VLLAQEWGAGGALLESPTPTTSRKIVAERRKNAARDRSRGRSVPTAAVHTAGLSLP